MIVESTPFNPQADIKPVDQFGFVDLKSALVTNTVPTELPDSEVQYNGIDNPESILGKPRDVFDALAMESSINEYDSSNKSEDGQ